MDLKITILYDNTVSKSGLQPDWGFSCLIDWKDKSLILFDTGANGVILLSNMTALDVDPQSIDSVFISHGHFDHTGGLSSFLNANSKVTVYCPDSFRGVRRAKKVVHVNNFLELHEQIYSTGELNGIEQSLVLETEKGIVFIVGCAHPGMETIFQSVSRLGSVRAVIGGFHGFRKYDLFRNVDLICPTHCTQNQKEISDFYSKKTIQGGVGRVIHIPD